MVKIVSGILGLVIWSSLENLVRGWFMDGGILRGNRKVIK